MSDPTTQNARAEAIAASMRQAFADAQRDLPADDLIVSASRQVAGWGDLGMAVSTALAENPWDPAKPVLLAYESALQEVGHPELIAARMLREADDLEASAKRHDELGADYAQMAEARRALKWPEEALEQFDRSAASHAACAAEDRCKAADLRRRAQLAMAGAKRKAA